MGKFIHQVSKVKFEYSIELSRGNIFEKENYSAEIISAVEAALVDLRLWLEEDEADPLLLASLQKHADVINGINHRYWVDDFPEDKAVEKLKVKRLRGVKSGRSKAATWPMRYGSSVRTPIGWQGLWGT